MDLIGLRCHESIQNSPQYMQGGEYLFKPLYINVCKEVIKRLAYFTVHNHILFINIYIYIYEIRTKKI